jgi:ABC-2 type transport system permease protein
MVTKKNAEKTSVTTKHKKAGSKRQNLLQLGISLLIIVLLNIIFSYLFTRFDLTTEKRYSLSSATKQFIEQVDDVVLFKVYLDGDFPAGFKRLRSETKEMLDEFRAYNDNIQYKFINPSEGTDKKAIKKLHQQLMSKGLLPTDLQVKTSDGSSRQLIFPGALVTYKGREVPLQLLVSQQGVGAEEQLNHSIQGLEYNLANVIRKLVTVVKPRIAFIDGQAELSDLRLADISNALSEYYSVERVTINSKITALATRDTIKNKFVNKFKLIVIAKPDSAFAEKDKFFIDQFVMRGGKVLWLIDPVYANMDSLRTSDQTVAFAKSLNLEDMLFDYGVRINTDLILDLNALPIPIVTGQSGGKPTQEFMPWYFFPLLTPAINHPIVNNLNLITTEFISSIDTVGGKGIRKTILLTTSQYSSPVNTPARISLDLLNKKLDKRSFKSPFQPVAVLLQGQFKSVFKDRLPLEITQDKANFDYREQSPENAMIVISDGDIIKNQIDFKQGYALPLGYDQYTNQTFGNKDFILNCVDYLCDDSGLMTVRSRELKLRLLDKEKIKNSRLNWQLLNSVLPILLILVFGLIQLILRKRKYTRPIKK